MSTLKERLEQALAAKPGATKADLARACGISKPAVSSWFSGSTQSIEGQNLIRASGYLGVRPEWLATGRGSMVGGDTVQTPPAPAYTLIPIEEWGDGTPLDDDEVELKIYKSAEWSSGPGKSQQVIVDEGARLRYGRRSLRKAGVDIGCAAGGLNTGNSNEPLIPDGAIVMLDESKTKIVDGEPYGIDHLGQFRVKFLYKLPGGGLRLRSYNREEYPDEDYGADWHEQIRVVGWVWTWQPPIRKWKG